MTDEYEKYGIAIGTKAPSFDTVDTGKNEVSLANLLTNSKGVVIDFFRGNW